MKLKNISVMLMIVIRGQQDGWMDDQSYYDVEYFYDDSEDEANDVDYSRKPVPILLSIVLVVRYVKYPSFILYRQVFQINAPACKGKYEYDTIFSVTSSEEHSCSRCGRAGASWTVPTSASSPSPLLGSET